VNGLLARLPYILQQFRHKIRVFPLTVKTRHLKPATFYHAEKVKPKRLNFCGFYSTVWSLFETLPTSHSQSLNFCGFYSTVWSLFETLPTSHSQSAKAYAQGFNIYVQLCLSGVLCHNGQWAPPFHGKTTKITSSTTVTEKCQIQRIMHFFWNSKLMEIASFSKFAKGATRTDYVASVGHLQLSSPDDAMTAGRTQTITIETSSCEPLTAWSNAIFYSSISFNVWHSWKMCSEQFSSPSMSAVLSDELTDYRWLIHSTRIIVGPIDEHHVIRSVVNDQWPQLGDAGGQEGVTEDHLDINLNNSRPFCHKADYLIISDCCYSISSCFRYIGLKRIGVTSLTFRGHMTSSVMWPFPIGCPLEPSLTVSEIFNGECDAMVDMTLNDL